MPFVAWIAAYNSGASGLVLVTAGIAIVATHFALKFHAERVIPAVRPQFGNCCRVLTKKRIAYRCQKCSYFWDTGWKTDGSGSAGGLE